jgi:transcriptional regulator with XRE-family HTH domain
MPLDRSITQEELLHDFGNRLRCLRKARKLRQLDMEDFGLSYKYYQRLEAGQVNPTLLTLHKVAMAFEVSVCDFFRPQAGPTPHRQSEPVCRACCQGTSSYAAGDL